MSDYELHTSWPEVEMVPTFVNTGASHMALGLADHLAHLRQLAARGEKDES